MIDCTLRVVLGVLQGHTAALLIFGGLAIALKEESIGGKVACEVGKNFLYCQNESKKTYLITIQI
jgi:hypothetical protein